MAGLASASQKCGQQFKNICLSPAKSMCFFCLPLSRHPRLYSEAGEELHKNQIPLRMVLQASAGTGKSFLLETLYLWCTVNGFQAEACAPTGIAAARIHVPRTPVRAYTVHNMFALTVDLESQIDPSKPEDERTQRLRQTTVLFIDEASMIDDRCWWAIRDQLSTVAEAPAQSENHQPHPQS